MLMNEIQQKTLLTVIIVAGIPFIALCSTILVRIVQGSAALVIIMVISIALISAVLAVIFLVGGMAQLFAYSDNFLLSVNRLIAKPTCTLSDKRTLRKFVLSCNKISAKFGFMNYVESITPLNCIDFSNQLTVQLLLLSN